MWGDCPLSEEDVFAVFVNYVKGKIARLPWCETMLLPETGTISQQLVDLNRAGFLTINSQPRVNGVRSDDATFGWGGSGGYVYQKAYIECFCSPGNLAALLEACKQFPAVTYHSVDMRGNAYSNYRHKGVQAVTWGVFPAKEVLQPTVVDPEAFLAWKAEAFALWQDQWAAVYEEDTVSYNLLHDIAETYFLVSLVDHDFIAGDVFAVFYRAMELAGKGGSGSSGGGGAAGAAGSGSGSGSSGSGGATANAAAGAGGAGAGGGGGGGADSSSSSLRNAAPGPAFSLARPTTTTSSGFMPAPFFANPASSAMVGRQPLQPQVVPQQQAARAGMFPFSSFSSSTGAASAAGFGSSFGTNFGGNSSSSGTELKPFERSFLQSLHYSGSRAASAGAAGSGSGGSSTGKKR